MMCWAAAWVCTAQLAKASLASILIAVSGSCLLEGVEESVGREVRVEENKGRVSAGLDVGA